MCLSAEFFTCVCVYVPPLPSPFSQLSNDLGMNIRPKQSLTFAKCLEMGLQNHVEEISKVGEVAGKEYAIEQVSGLGEHLYLSEQASQHGTLEEVHSVHYSVFCTKVAYWFWAVVS